MVWTKKNNKLIESVNHTFIFLGSHKPTYIIIILILNIIYEGLGFERKKNSIEKSVNYTFISLSVIY